MNPPPSLASFQLVSVPHSSHPPEESFHDIPQVNADIHLVHTLRGIGSMTVGGRTYETNPSCVFCIPPHVQCRYAKKPGQPWEMINLHFLFSPSRTLADHPLLPLQFSPRNIKAIHAKLRSIHRHTLNPGPWGNANALAGALSLVLSYFEAHGSINRAIPASGQDAIAESVRRTLDAKAALPMDVDALAAASGLSASQLSRRFKTHTGQSLKQYWSARRLAAVESLLRDTDWPLEKIARQLHFSDVFYLSRWFSTHARLSPTDYRKKSRTLAH